MWTMDTLPIFPEKFLYRVKDKVKHQYSVIESLLKKADEIYIATDAGREGELIARLILRQANCTNKNIYRIWTSEALTKDVILRELNAKKPLKDYDTLFYSAIARSHADWLVGINLTRLASLLINNKELWSVGRVQTPVLKLIVERELEIQNFVPEPFWYLAVYFKKDNVEFLTKLYHDKKINFEDKAFLEKVLKDIQPEKTGIVEKITENKKSEPPPLLFSITTLQMEANKRFSYSANKTLSIAQELYEKKFISYPRTESQHLDENAKPLAKSILKKLQREDLIPNVDKVGTRVFNNKKLTDHYAIIPMRDEDESLSDEEKKIFSLIKNRFLGAFCDNYVYLVKTVFIKIKDYTFVSKGKEDVSLGWKALEKDEKEEDKLPPLQEKEQVEKTKEMLVEDKTKPPARYTEAHLLEKMKELSLGTGATRSLIIETLKQREYVRLSQKALVPTEKALFLIDKFKDRAFTSPELTSSWELMLEDIQEKKISYKDFMAKIKEFLNQEIASIKTIPMTYQEKPICKCRCGADVIPKKSVYVCPSCNLKLYKEVFHKKLKDKEIALLFKGEEVYVDKLISKNGKPFGAYLRLEQDGIKLRFK